MTTESIAVRDGEVQQRLANIMLEAKAIGKDSQNRQQGFNFRGIDAIMNHLHGIFAKYGIIILPEVLAERTEERTTKSGGNLIYRVLTVRFNFVAPDGSRVYSTVIGEGMDSGDKAANKAMAVALKYALTQMLLLPYDEVDADATTPEQSKRKPLPASVATPVPAMPPPAPANVDIKPLATRPAPPVNGSVTVEVVLGEVKEKKGKSAKGPWARTYAQADDGEYYSTFDTKLGQFMHDLQGGEALLTYVIEQTPKGESRKVIAVRPVAEPELPPDPDASGSTGSEGTVVDGTGGKLPF